MVQSCIFCLNEKPNSEFNEEHIFPSSLGGAIIINNLCKKCNSDFGRTIDQPFLSHAAVLYYRNIFDLTRNDGRRKGLIPNPIKTTHTDKHGNRYRAVFKDNKLSAEVIEKLTFEHDSDNDKFIGKITVSKDKVDNIDEIIKKHAKRQGLEITEYQITSKELKPFDEFQVTVDADNNTFIFGCLKIAYEVIMNLYPKYQFDSMFELLRQTLKEVSFKRRFKKIQERNHKELMLRYDNIFKKIQGMDAIHHCVLIENLKGIGLVCCVRVFNWFYPVVLSQNAKIIKESEAIFIYNNALDRFYASNIFAINSNIKLTIDTYNLSPEIIQAITNRDERLFSNSEGFTSIYNSDGKVVYKTPENICDDKSIKNQTYQNWFGKGIEINFSGENLFLKTSEGLIVPLLGITFDREMVLQKVY